MRAWRSAPAAAAAAAVVLLLLLIVERPLVSEAHLKRCVSCRSRGELGSCKDPFTMNYTQIENEKGVEAVPCASGWCVKIIESKNLNNEYGTATERSCLQRGPDDNEERCAFTKWNYKNVYMCFCKGDMCNAASTSSVSLAFYSIAVAAVFLRWLY